MKRNILIAFSAIVLAGGVFVASKAATPNYDSILSSNVEALCNSEVISIEVVCKCEPKARCTYNDVLIANDYKYVGAIVTELIIL